MGGDVNQMSLKPRGIGSNCVNSAVIGDSGDIGGNTTGTVTEP